MVPPPVRGAALTAPACSDRGSVSATAPGDVNVSGKDCDPPSVRIRDDGAKRWISRRRRRWWRWHTPPSCRRRRPSATVARDPPLRNAEGSRIACSAVVASSVRIATSPSGRPATTMVAAFGVTLATSTRRPAAPSSARATAASGWSDRALRTRAPARSATSAKTCAIGNVSPGRDGNRASGEPLSRSTTPRHPVVSKYVTESAPLVANASSDPTTHAAPSSDACRTSTGAGRSSGPDGPPG